MSAFDYDSGEYVDVASELPCYEFTENTLNPATYPDCELFVKSSIKPQHFGFFRIEKSPYGPTLKSE